VHDMRIDGSDSLTFLYTLMLHLDFARI